MSDQNQNSQNSIPGTLRTLKTDLGIDQSNPQDRLQQAGNFVQARPTIDTPDSVSLENQVVEKKDIPVATSSSTPSYSWSNMSTSQLPNSKIDFNLDSKKDASAPAPTINTPINKSGFSVLEDNLNIPLENKGVNNYNNQTPSPELPPIAVDSNNQSAKFDINSLGLDDENVSKPKSSLKSIISAVVVVSLLVLIGGGIYLFNTSRTNTNNVTTNNQTPEPTPEPQPVDTPLLTNIPKVDISFVDSEPIRRTILSRLSDKKDSLIELNLTKDGNKVSLTDVSDALTLTIPANISSELKNYWLYAYNQEGIYKLTAVMQLNEDINTREVVETWGNSIPRDLSGFSINLPSRIVNIATIKTSTITSDNGKSFNNNYYNYTSPADSIDVSSYENYILMASSQDSMRYILNQIQ
jgi:hypothetical protein